MCHFFNGKNNIKIECHDNTDLSTVFRLANFLRVDRHIRGFLGRRNLHQKDEYRGNNSGKWIVISENLSHFLLVISISCKKWLAMIETSGFSVLNQRNKSVNNTRRGR